MQRFADQAAIAWHNALRQEAQRRANRLRRVLDRVLRLAPSFHVSSNTEAVAKAICKAALATFGCSGAALYLVEGERLRVLDRTPHLEGPCPRAGPSPSPAICLWHTRYARPARPSSPNVGPSRAARPGPPTWSDGPAPVRPCTCPCASTSVVRPIYSCSPGTNPRKQPDDSFLAVVQRFADQAAVALTHASAERLHARLEASLLPAAPSTTHSSELSPATRPASSASGWAVTSWAPLSPRRWPRLCHR